MYEGWGRTFDTHTQYILYMYSLSEPHTSVTALHTCVYLCLDHGPTTYRNFKSAHSNISQRRNVHADVRVLQPSRENEREGLLPDCRVGMKESESEDNSSSMH